ncbi:MAG: hypothetical protein V2A73_08560 [Pseudomonadota bacterium]
MRKRFPWRGLLLACTLFVSYGYFYQAGGWNQNSRFDLVRAVVERGTFSIDAYHHNTGDASFLGGHWYSDKAPGSAFAAIPVVAVARAALGAGGEDALDSPRAIAVLSYAATLATSSLPTAFAALLLMYLARRLGSKETGAGLAAIVFGLATPAWAYATLFWGHQLAAACLVAAFAAAIELASDRPAAGAGAGASDGDGYGLARLARRDIMLAFALGLALGLAVMTEYQAAPPALVLFIYALAGAWKHGRRRRLLMVGLGALAGALPSVALLCWYHHAAFGSVFAIGYSHVYGWGGMKQGLMGITYPKPSVLARLLVAPERGLLVLAPALFVAPLGLVAACRSASNNGRIAILASAIAGYYLLLNASYVYWSGGWTYGPRHLAPAIPFLCLLLGPAWTIGRKWLRLAILVGAVLGAAFAFVVVTTTAQPPEGLRGSVSELCWPAFRDGDLSLNHQSFLEARAWPRELRGTKHQRHAWNMGQLVGLRGHASLLPLAAIWFLAAYGWWWLGRGETSK